MLNQLRDLIQNDIGQRGLRTDPRHNLVNARPDDFGSACKSLADTPNAALAVPPAPGSDVSLLNTDVGNPDFRFIRFQVEFDIDTLNLGITPASPLPALDFLRLPFRY